MGTGNARAHWQCASRTTVAADEWRRSANGDAWGLRWPARVCWVGVGAWGRRDGAMLAARQMAGRRRIRLESSPVHAGGRLQGREPERQRGRRDACARSEHGDGGDFVSVCTPASVMARPTGFDDLRGVMAPRGGTAGEGGVRFGRGVRCGVSDVSHSGPDADTIALPFSYESVPWRESMIFCHRATQ